jgi:hypothetical protein
MGPGTDRGRAAAARLDRAKHIQSGTKFPDRATAQFPPPVPDTEQRLLSHEELEAALRDIGARRYHNLHPFHRLLHDGKLSKDQA